MSSTPDPGDRAALLAARELRSAVHGLALGCVTRQPDATTLSNAAELVRSAAALLAGDDLPPAMPPGIGAAAEPEGLGGYRRRSLFQGDLHPFAPALRWEAASGPGGEPAHAFRVTLSQLYQGPPAAVHGGYIAGLFDELLGAVQGLAREGGGYTGKLEIRYRDPTPLDRELCFVGWIVSDKGRRVQVAATCTAGETRCADAHGLFVRPAERRLGL